METILEKLQDESQVTSFLKIINETNFVEILDAEGRFTLFAPINDAFLYLPRERWENIVRDATKITDIIGEHLIVGYFKLANLSQSDEVTNMNGRTLAVEKHNEGIIIGGARIIQQNIECSNGVIHLIDLVLLP